MSQEGEGPCNFCLRILRCNGIIKTFQEIEETGDLPEGFYWRSIHWDERLGWRGYVSGPGGETSWLMVRKIPADILASLNL